METFHELEFSPNGTHIAAASAASAASGESALNVWQVDGLTGRVSHTIPDRVTMSLAFLREGEDLAFVSYEGGLRILSSTGWNEITMSNDRCESAVAASPDSRFLATASVEDSSNVLLLNAGSLSLEQTLHGHDHFVVSFCFSPTRPILVSGGFDNVAKVWNFESGECLATLHHDVWVGSLAFSRDGRFLAAAGSLSGVVKVWDMQTYTCVAEHDVRGGVNSIEYSKCGKYLFVAQVSEFGYVSVFKTDGTGQNVTIECDEQSAISALTVSPDGELLATGTLNGGRIRLWSIDKITSLFAARESKNEEVRQ
ncbi:MAG: hypothetical protein ABI619_09195 [Betaproteobacteria bacterium]